MNPISTGRAGRERAIRVFLAALLFGGASAVTLHDWFGLGGSGLDYAAEGPVYDAVVTAAGLACLLRARAAERERGAWLAIGAAILFWGASEVYWTAFILNDPTPPYPSPADLGYLAFYPLAALGVALLVRARTHELDWRLWMDGVIAALGTAALGAAFVFDFVANRTTGSPLQVATTLAYPLGDVLMFSLVVGVVALTRWRPGRTWSLLLAGLAALVIADVAFTLQENGALPGGVWTDPIYLIAAAFLGAEAWQPRADTIAATARFDGWRELMVPALSGTVMIGLFALQYFTAASALSTVLWGATMVAVILRLAISVRENKALLEQVRTDSLTGLGNRGGMQVDLEAHCERASTEQPVTLMLFDLNGFKRFNDTFGHPAGDTLLARLGRQLRAGLDGDGAAYRIGGDEFCVLLSCEESRLDAAKREAATALSASGRGYEVTASWGAAAIPAEASTPSEALQLADVRMYAQKESRRIALDAAGAPLGLEGAGMTRAPSSRPRAVR
ncbi:MAG: GGDEF domain-containing protein [Solirubrobacterales bacterium]